MTNEQRQLADRCRKLATQMDELTIALRQRGAPQVSTDDAAVQMRAMAPLEQAMVRYRLAMLNYMVPLTD